VPALLKTWLKRLLIVALVLGVLGLIAFTWLFYWPLEGGQDKVEDLVPGSADFLLKTTWAELRNTGFVQTNVRDEPLAPDRRKVWRDQIQPQLDQVGAIESQVNAQIPLGLTRLSIENDIFPGEIVISGRFCRDIGPPRPPSWRELLLLFRTGWKGKLFAGLSHEFIRDRVNEQGQGVTITPTDDADIFKLVFRNVPVSDARTRTGCGDGFIMPPENVWYGARIRDVLAFSNSETLIARAVDLGRGTGTDSFGERPGFSLDAPSGSIAAAVDLGPMHLYLRRLIELGGPRMRAVKDFLDMDSLDRLNGYVALASTDMLAGRARIRLAPGGLNAAVQEAYSGPPLDLRAGLASYVPAEDTYAFVQLRTDPQHLLMSIYRHVLSEDEQHLWDDNLRNQDERLYPDVETFLRDVASRLGDSVGISFARLSELYDTVTYPSFASENLEVDPNPGAGAIAFVIPLRTVGSAKEVDEFLAQRVHLMGFSSELERVEHAGFTYTKLKFQQLQDAANFRLIRPAYILVQDRLVLATHETYLRKILDVYAEAAKHPPLSADPTFRTTMEGLPEKGHLSAWLDLEKVTRVPPRATDLANQPDPPGGPRGLLWDQRKRWLEVEKDPTAKARELRAAIKQQRFGNRPLDNDEEDRLDAEVAAQMKPYEARYAEFLEERRAQIAGLRRGRALGLVLQGHGSEPITAEAVILFRPADAPPGS
jgi:hypothetical protein